MSARIREADPVIAVYPGTFDPVTNGHLDIIERGSRIFGHVIVAILENPEKSPLLSVEERRQMIEKATSGLKNVRVESFAGLLVDYARTRRAKVIVRGLRALSDFEYEFQMALMNRRLNPRMETVFMMPNEAYSYLSSRLVKEVVTLGGSVRGLVPREVERLITARARRPGGLFPSRPGDEGGMNSAPGGEGSAVGAHGSDVRGGPGALKRKVKRSGGNERARPGRKKGGSR